MASLMREWIAAKVKAKEIGEGTQRNYAHRVKSLERRAPDFATKPIEQIERKHIVEAHGRYRETPWMGDTVLVAVRAALAWAVETERLAANPAATVKCYSPTCRRRKDLSRNESRAIIEAAHWAERDGEITQEEADFEVAGLVLGWRQHELRGMRSIDLDLMRGEARPAFKGEKGQRKWVPIGPEMVALFRRRAEAVGPGEYLFGGPKKWNRTKPWTIWQAILPYAEKLGVDISDEAGRSGKIRPHITRSANIDEKRALGAEISDIADSVNHSRLSTTRKYMGRGSKRLRPLAEQVELSFLGPPEPSPQAPNANDLQIYDLPSQGFQRCAPPQKSVERAANSMTNIGTTPTANASRAKKEIGQLIKGARERAGKEIGWCADMLGKSKETWANWERSGCGQITVLFQIAPLLGVSVRDLLPDSIETPLARAAS